jgi:hypothetical protein
MSAGNDILPATITIGSLQGPFRDLEAIQGFKDKPLNGGYGTYSVYPVFLPDNTNPSNFYKCYIVTVFLTNLPQNAQSNNNPMPQPYITTLGETFPNGFVGNGVNLEVNVAAGGQTMYIKNFGITLTNFRVSLFVIGV